MNSAHMTHHKEFFDYPNIRKFEFSRKFFHCEIFCEHDFARFSVWRRSTNASFSTGAISSGISLR